MTISATRGRLMVLLCGGFAFTLASAGGTLAAPRAAALGPEAPLAQPVGGYVGRLSVTPEHGPVGTPLAVTGEGFPAEQELQLVWRTVKGRWKVTIAEYHGREYTPVAYRIATVKSDKDGRIARSRRTGRQICGTCNSWFLGITDCDGERAAC